MACRSKFILWGSSGHAKVLADLIREQNGEIIALFDNSERAVSIVAGVPIWYGKKGFQEWVSRQDDLHDVSAAVAIGGARGVDRLQITYLFREHGFRLPNLIHIKACIAPSVELGEANQFLANSNVASDAKIGNACIINHNANIDHECVIGNGVHIAPSATLCGCVTIDDFVLIGAGAVILPRIKIGENAIVGAGAVVTRDVPPCQTVIGNPARHIKM
jgi:sugar O-acyltransferase (sialic acid O-acetyltransferase NeuD family)